VWHEALLGTGALMRLLVRPCQPRTASARAVLLSGRGVGALSLFSAWGVDSGLSALGAGLRMVGGGGFVKKSDGRYVRMASISRPSGRRRLNS